MANVEAAACCVQQWQWVSLRKISVDFALTDTMSDVKENYGGWADHRQQQQQQLQEADEAYQPASPESF